MSAYLKFFELEQSPFEGKAQAQIVLGTRALRDAFGTIQTGLAEGVSRICVSGQRGLGKTSLARALPKLLGETARVALVPDPTLSWEATRGPLAKQWGLASGGLPRAHLIEAARHRRLVIVIDQAERASEEFLDHLDVILSYRSEDSQPVVQSVLLARLKADEGEAPAPLVWWLDRIQTLQLEFAPLPRDGIESYIRKHLKRAGWRGQQLFSEDAAHAIHGYTGGVPGAVSELCEQLLREAATRNLSAIDADLVHSFCDVDSEQTQAEARTLEDEFEELALEDEFSDAHESPSAIQPEAEAEVAIELTLVATATGLVDTRAKDETDAACGPVWTRETAELSEEDPLDAPPTREELRAIRGSGLSRIFRTFAVAAIAAVVGGVAFAMFARDPGPELPDLSDSLARTTQRSNPTESPATRPGTGLPNQTQQAEKARPLVMIQPGDGFVPIEMLEGGSVRRNDRVTKANPIASGRERNPESVRSPARPAAPAPFGDDLPGTVNPARQPGSR